MSAALGPERSPSSPALSLDHGDRYLDRNDAQAEHREQVTLPRRLRRWLARHTIDRRRRRR